MLPHYGPSGFKIASEIRCPKTVTCVVGCLARDSCQDHPAHIPRGGQISPDPSFTSWRRAAGVAARVVLASAVAVRLRP